MSENPFLSNHEAVCPDNLLKLAREHSPARTAIVRAGSALPMQAAKAAVDEGIMEPVFVGEKDEIEREAEALSWDISGFEIVATTGEKEAADAGALLGNRREVDVIMKGNLHTDAFMGALIRKDTGIRTSNRLVHVFYITDPVEQRPMIVSDAAVNVTPDMKTRQSALVAVDELARRTGIERPKIAVLSATESAIPSVPTSIQAAELAEWAGENVPTSDVRGPLALDLILSQKSAETKGLGDDPVAGKADAIIVPDLVSGNAIFKALVYLSGGCAAGIVLGGTIPVLLTSRADPAAARLASAALASIMR
ncbi:MAG: phosphate acetyltransferase [Rhizobiaceae bacterium]|nr:phosphate acetyltransferase [Rhizobiaceae bacterium]